MRLSSKSRNALPKSSFGLPGKRAYPMPDASHAQNAKARATQQVKAGNLSPSAKANIDAKANRILGESKGSPVKKALPASFKAHQFKKGGSAPKAPPAPPAMPSVASAPMTGSSRSVSSAPVSNMEPSHAAMFRKAFSGKSG